MHLSNHSRDFLIEHMDGAELAINRQRGSARISAMNGLLHRGLIEYVHPNGSKAAHPRYTRITMKGRAYLAKMLADYADVLTRLTSIVAPKPLGDFSTKSADDPMDNSEYSREGLSAGQGQTALAGSEVDHEISSLASFPHQP